MSLQTRFILIFGLGNVLFLTLVTLLVFDRMQGEMIDQLQQQFHMDARGKIQELKRSLQQTAERFQSVASVPMFRVIRFHQLTLNEAAQRDDIRQLELYFLDLQRNQVDLQSISFIGVGGGEIFRVEQGSIVRKLRDFSINPEVSTGLELGAGKTRVTVLRQGGEIESLVWWVPVFASQRVRLGVLVFRTSFVAFRARILAMGHEETEWVCLEAQGAFLVGEHCGGEDQDGHWQAEGELGLAGLQWILRLHADPAGFLKDVDRLRVIVFGFILPAVAVLALLVIALTSRRISRSVNDVVKAARMLGEGGVYVPIEVTRRDELGQLTREVNRAAGLIEEKTAALEVSNRELESYSYSIAHDLRAPLRAVTSFSQLLELDAADKLNEEELDCLKRVISAGARMSQLIDDILELSRISRSRIGVEALDLSAIARDIAHHLEQTDTGREVDWRIQDGLTVSGDEALLRVLMENLLGNAWKYSREEEAPCIEFGARVEGGKTVYHVRDNGVGFDMKYADNLFKPFQRLHRSDEFEGSGVGLATVHRVVKRHNGRVWVEAEVGRFASVYFTLNE